MLRADSQSGCNALPLNGLGELVVRVALLQDVQLARGEDGSGLLVVHFAWTQPVRN